MPPAFTVLGHLFSQRVRRKRLTEPSRKLLAALNPLPGDGFHGVSRGRSMFTSGIVDVEVDADVVVVHLRHSINVEVSYGDRSCLLAFDPYAARRQADTQDTPRGRRRRPQRDQTQPGHADPDLAGRARYRRRLGRGGRGSGVARYVVDDSALPVPVLVS